MRHRPGISAIAVTTLARTPCLVDTSCSPVLDLSLNTCSFTMHAVILGASSGCANYAAIDLLAANKDNTITVLLRKPDAAEETKLGPYVDEGRCEVVQGDATKEEDLKKLFVEMVDVLISGITPPPHARAGEGIRVSTVSRGDVGRFIAEECASKIRGSTRHLRLDMTPENRLVVRDAACERALSTPVWDRSLTITRCMFDARKIRKIYGLQLTDRTTAEPLETSLGMGSPPALLSRGWAGCCY